MFRFLPLFIGVIIAIGLVGGAVYLRGRNQGSASQGNNAPGFSPNAPGNPAPKNNTLTAAELAAFDGQNGNKCYVAVDSKVYEIEQGRLWNDGKHDTSNGAAACGRDLTEVMGQSPHGRSKLEMLTVVGSLAQ